MSLGRRKKMRKNILTIIILAMAIINVILTAVIIFAIVPTANKTNQLVSKVSQLIDLELESPEEKGEVISVSDINIHEFKERLTINLKKSGSKNNYAALFLSLSVNSKHKDTVKLETLIDENEYTIKEIVTDEFSKYTIEDVRENKDLIKNNSLKKIQEYFNSDFIINVSFGNLIFE